MHLRSTGLCNLLKLGHTLPQVLILRTQGSGLGTAQMFAVKKHAMYGRHAQTQRLCHQMHVY
jgi:hypothetical protein